MTWPAGGTDGDPPPATLGRLAIPLDLAGVLGLGCRLGLLADSCRFEAGALMAEAKLKPCPFCGMPPTFQAAVLRDEGPHSDPACVMCWDCDISIESDNPYKHTSEADRGVLNREAIDRWNTRPTKPLHEAN